MGDPSTLAAPLSPRALAAAQHVTAIEAELVQLRAEVAPTLERIATLERSLEAVELAAHPKQAALLDIGNPLPPVSPLREPSMMAETLLRRAVALAAEGEVGMPRLVIARDSMHRGELKCAHALAAGVRPLLVEESCTKAAKVYRLTADGETVARALPVKTEAT